MPRYAATKLFEGDEPMQEELGLSESTRHIIDDILTQMEHEAGMERAAVMADTRYRFIEKMLSTCYTRASQNPNTLTDRIDGVLTHPVLAIPVFLLMMALVFYITFGPIGTWVADSFAALEASIRAEMQAQMDADPQIDYYIEDEQPGGVLTALSADQPFFFTENGDLVIVYDKYTIAPGSMGNPAFTIPKSVYEPLLK